MFGPGVIEMKRDNLNVRQLPIVGQTRSKRRDLESSLDPSPAHSDLSK